MKLSFWRYNVYNASDSDEERSISLGKAEIAKRWNQSEKKLPMFSPSLLGKYVHSVKPLPNKLVPLDLLAQQHNHNLHNQHNLHNFTNHSSKMHEKPPQGYQIAIDKDSSGGKHISDSSKHRNRHWSRDDDVEVFLVSIVHLRTWVFLSVTCLLF